MKIAVIGTRGFPGVQGGVETHCEHLYLHLIDKGCDITVFTRKPYVTYEGNLFRGIRLISVGCPRNRFLEAIVHTFKCVIKAKMLHPDILHIHAIGPSLFAPFARLLGMRVVVTNHGPDYMRKKWSLPAKIFLRFCESMGMVFANEIIAIADNIADSIMKKYRKPAKIIPNGVEVPVPENSYEVLRKYDLQRRKYILSVGRFVPEKGFHDLIDAFNKLKVMRNKSQIDEWKLVIVGDADHEDKYSLQLKEKAAGHNNIVLTGYLSGISLRELYSHAGLFVLPSYHEGLPIVLLEAMSYGLSCIASDIPANRNVRLDDERFFEPSDIKMLFNKMNRFIEEEWNDEEQKKQISMIDKVYNWDKIADKTLKVYQKAVSDYKQHGRALLRIY